MDLKSFYEGWFHTWENKISQKKTVQLISDFFTWKKVRTIWNKKTSWFAKYNSKICHLFSLLGSQYVSLPFYAEKNPEVVLWLIRHVRYKICRAKMHQSKNISCRKNNCKKN